jgi:hypothetical protein
MQTEKENFSFDFTKKIEKVIEEQTSGTLAKKIKFASFLVLGGISIGIGLGVTNGLMDAHIVTRTSEAKIAEMKATNEQLLKAKNLEVDASAYAKKVERESKENIDKKSQEQQLSIDRDRQTYDLWIKNKEDIIANYEAQLDMYDPVYKNMLKAVDMGIGGLEQLSEVRGYYQKHKKETADIINYIQRNITTFENFRSLDEENRKFLNEKLVEYQVGSLNRSGELEDNLMKHINRERDDVKKEAIRNEIRNDMITNLAQVMSHENVVTKTKKLKR